MFQWRSSKKVARSSKKICSLVRCHTPCLRGVLTSSNLLDGYGIYQDSTDFPYDITLARANLLTNKNERFALKVCPLPNGPPCSPRHTCVTIFILTRCHSSTISTPTSSQSAILMPRVVLPCAYTLKLYVSHATPKYFSCNVKYSSPGSTPKFEVLAPIGSSWETAWAAFEAFFKLKAKKDWDMRFLKPDLGVDAAEAFVYTPPREGEPRGLFLEV